MVMDAIPDKSKNPSEITAPALLERASRLLQKIGDKDKNKKVKNLVMVLHSSLKFRLYKHRKYLQAQSLETYPSKSRRSTANRGYSDVAFVLDLDIVFAMTKVK